MSDILKTRLRALLYSVTLTCWEAWQRVREKTYHSVTLPLAALLFLGLGMCPWQQAQAQDWQVKRKDRRVIVIHRLRRILHSNPHSRYALSKLWSMHRGTKSRQRLVNSYQRLVQKHPANTTYRIILARLLERNRKWLQALQLYQKLPARPGDPQTRTIQLAQARCYLGLKRPQRAIAVLKDILHKLPDQQRRKMLRKLLEETAGLKDAPQAFQFVMAAIQKESWNQHQKLSMARLLARHQRWDKSFHYYQQGLKSTRGQTRMLLLLELVRHQIRAQHYKNALLTIEQARKMKTRNDWIGWELLQQEIVVYRGQKQLALLVSRLDHKWRNSREYREVLLLAQLYEELKVTSQAIQFYKKALSLRPSEREPRLRLLSWYSKRKNLVQVRLHLRQLIKYRHATPAHYLQFAKDLLERSGKYPQQRWNPAWKHMSYCQHGSRSYYRNRRYRRFIYRNSRRYYRRQSDQHRCSRQAWESYRQRRWKFWQRYEATASKRRMLQEAVKLLEQCSKRYPHQWDTLQQIEQLLSQYGYPGRAHRVRRKMIKAVDAYVYRIEATQLLLFQEGQTQQLRRVAVQALKDRAVPLKRAVKVAAHVYKRPIDPADPADGIHQRKHRRQQKVWERKMCPVIAHFLRPAHKRVKPANLQNEPLVVLHLNALLWRCGSRNRTIQKQLQQLENNPAVLPQQLDKVLRLYTQYRMSEGLKRLLSLLQARHAGRWVGHLNQALRASMTPEAMRYLLQQLTANKALFRDSPEALSQLLLRICRHRSSCLAVVDQLEKLTLMPQTPIQSVIALMKKLKQHRLLRDPRFTEWVSQVINSRRKKVHELHQLAEAYLLFSYPTALRKLHSALLTFVLQQRQTAPARAYLWGTMLRRHLGRLKPHYANHQADIQRIDQAAARFPTIYRHVLSFYLTNYYYRKDFGPKKLMERLKKGIHLDDLPFLEKVYYRLPHQKRESLFTMIMESTRRPEVLGWMYIFSQKYNLPRLRVVCLRKLLRLRPKDTRLTRHLAMALDKSPQHREQADQYWQQWLRRFPERYSPAALRKLSGQCCADSADRRLARRLLLLASETHTLRKIWPSLQTLFPMLGQDEQKQLLTALLKSPSRIKGFRLALARLSQQYQHHQVTIQLYRYLAQQPGATPAMVQSLAQALDREGNIAEANRYWRIYLQRKQLPQPQLFFQQQALQLHKQGKLSLARIAYYRAWKFGKHNKAPDRELLTQLQQDGKSLQAWALWLYLQGSRAQSCLAAKANAQTLSLNTATLLWQLNVAYHGPVALFPPCEWMLSSDQQSQLLPVLVKYLQQNPKQQIALTGSADPENEPDAAFLSEQRAKSLQQMLIKHGISDQRITVKTAGTTRFCTPQKSTPPTSRREKPQPSLKSLSLLKVLRYRNQIKRLLLGGYRPNTQTTHKLSCRLYRRQVAIVLESKELISRASFTSQDADKDGVPDFADHCPLQPTTRSYRRRYYRYRYRYGLRYRSRYRPHQTNTSKPGCPRYGKRLALRRVKDDVIELQQTFLFYRRLSSVRSTSLKVLDQIAALLRMAPHLGKLQIEFQASLQPSYDTYRRYRYRRYRGYRGYRRRRNTRSLPGSSSAARRLAQQRAARIRNYLRRKGVPDNMLQIRVYDKVTGQQTGATKPAYLTFRLIPPQPSLQP